MKKLFAILLVVTMLASMATVVSAAETTTLTTTVPAATYTLNIPADQEIEFGATSSDLGNVTITDATGFAEKKNLQVTVSYSNFECPNNSTTIPMLLYAETENRNLTVNINSGDILTFYGRTGGSVTECAQIRRGETNEKYAMTNLELRVNSEDWGKALGGEYSATITFTCEVVVEQ